MAPPLPVTGRVLLTLGWPQEPLLSPLSSLITLQAWFKPRQAPVSGSGFTMYLTLQR